MQSEQASVGAPDVPSEQWNHLDPAVKTLWVLGNLVGLFIVLGIGVGLDFAARSQPIVEAIGFRLYPGVAALLFILVFGMLPFVLIGLKYRNTLYLVTEDEVCTRSGIWWKSERYVPRARIQYVDVTSGPIERNLGLATLAVYVGGQAGAGANIAGLRGEVAEALRRELVAELPERQAAGVEPPPLADGGADEPRVADSGFGDSGGVASPDTPEEPESPENPWEDRGMDQGIDRGREE